MSAVNAMKVLVVTTSRADWNGLGMVARELVRREIGVWVCAYATRPDWTQAIGEDIGAFDFGSGALDRACIEYRPDVAVVAGDRSELLEACIMLCKYKVPICHIGGGDITEGSMDDRYRDAITALSTIHCAETEQAVRRLSGGHHPRFADDSVYLTGQPGLDRIRQTPLALPPSNCLAMGLPRIVVLVHPNTTHKDAMIDADAVYRAMVGQIDFSFVCIAANADPGGEQINQRWISLAADYRNFITFQRNLPPAQFYWLLANSQILLGNSSAGTAEAPCFGIPVVNVGDRQKGREFGPLTWQVDPDPTAIKTAINEAVATRDVPWLSPYGDGESAPRIVKALEDNAWRWTK